jgi:putative tryptophan/tyrosine transport system substrate-binding protein
MTCLRSAFPAICALLASSSAVLAQPAPGAFTVGLLLPAGATNGAASAFLKHMREFGYEQGRNLTLVVRAPKESNAELPALAAELAAMKPDALAVQGTTPALALKRATASIPIVAISIGDPVGAHLVESLAHPGGNVTGTAIATDLWTGKRAQQIKETLPGLRCVLLLRNPENLSSVMQAALWDKLAAGFGLVLRTIDAASGDELDRALAAPRDEDCKAAMLLTISAVFVARRSEIADYALKNHIALFGGSKEDGEAGALISFGVDFDDQSRVAAAYVDKILKGAKPETLPFQQPTKFLLVVNLKTAGELGVTIPQSILAGADEVIE